MTVYHPVNVDLTDCQKRNIANAYSNKKGLTIRLSVEQIRGNKDKLLLTQRQINKIEKHKNNNSGVDLDVSFKQLRTMQLGGVLPLIPLLTGAAKSVLAPLALSAASAAVTHGMNRTLGTGTKAPGNGETVTVALPKKHIEQLRKMLTELEKRNVIPEGSVLAMEEHIRRQCGGFVLPLVSTLLGTFLPSVFTGKKGSGIYFPFEETAAKN